MSKVTVVIPVYKTKEQLLRNCITSIINQTLKDIEIIIVDDGSPDNAGKICDEFAQIDNRIRVIHKDNEGVSVARNIGIEAAKSKYITFVDGDDWIDSETLEVAFNKCEEYKADILQWTYIWHRGEECVGGNSVFHVEGVLNTEQMEEMVMKSIIDFHPSFSCNQGFAAGAPWAKLYRTEFLNRNNLRFVPGLARSQDRIFNLYAYASAKRIAYIDKPFSHYVANDTSAVVSYRPNVEEVYGIYLNKIKEFLELHPEKSKAMEEAYSICICYVIQQIFTQFLFHENNSMQFRDVYHEVKRISNDEVYRIGINDCGRIKDSLTKKQYVVYSVLKMRMYLFATFMMRLKRKGKK